MALAAGLVAGAATLVRPSWLLFTPLAAMAGVLLGGRRAAGAVSPRWRQAVLGVAMLLPLALVMTPWWQRSQRLTGHFVPTTLQVGASLYDGLSSQATGASNMKPVAEFERLYRERHPPKKTRPPAQVEYRLDQRLQEAALGWLGTQPRAALRLAGIKFLRIWNIWPNEASFSALAVRLAVAVTYIPLLILGLVGAVRTLRCGWPYWLCWFPAVYFTALHVVFVGSIRYRQPAMLALMVLAAGVATGWTDVMPAAQAHGLKRREDRRRKIVVCVNNQGGSSAIVARLDQMVLVRAEMGPGPHRDRGCAGGALLLSPPRRADPHATAKRCWPSSIRA